MLFHRLSDTKEMLPGEVFVPSGVHLFFRRHGLRKSACRDRRNEPKRLE